MPNKAVKRTNKEIKALASKCAIKQKQSPPNWPTLMPLVPSYDLHLQTILEGQIVVVKKLFTSALSQRYVSFLSSLPLTTTAAPRRGEALRVNDRFQVQDADFAEALFSSTALKQLLEESSNDWGGEICGLNPNIRIYRYKQVQFFERHCEC